MEKDLSYRLRNLRTERGLTEEELANAIGCKKEAYAKKEDGTVPITATDILNITEFFNIPADFFFSRSPLEIDCERKLLLHGYNRLTEQGREAMLSMLNAFLLSQWSSKRYD